MKEGFYATTNFTRWPLDTKVNQNNTTMYDNKSLRNLDLISGFPYQSRLKEQLIKNAIYLPV